MNRNLVRYLVSGLAVSVSCVAWATGPKAYVITGYNKDADDKAWHDKIAAEAKSDLEAAGYKVTLITEGTKEQFKNAVADPDGKALVFIDHGTTGTARVRHKDGADGAAMRSTAEQFRGPFNNYKAVTIHACDQDQEAWKALFPNADFHSWGGCIYPSDELEWQKKKTYNRVTDPPQNDPPGAINGALQEDQFTTDGGVQVPSGSISGNWPMSPPLAGAFGNMAYNFFVIGQPPSSNDCLFSARVSGGVIVDNKPGTTRPDADFNWYMPAFMWEQARRFPEIMAQPGILGGVVQIQPMHAGVDPIVAFQGVVRNVFRIGDEGPACSPCPADFNQDGGIDGSDVGAFFGEWEAAAGCADVNQDGGVDGGDVEYFFSLWQAGGC